jgi:urocanate hydratase
MADLVALHSGGGGYSGYMTSAGVTVIADGTAHAAERIAHALTNDTALGLIRYADAGYAASLEEIEAQSVPHIRVG